jgi:kynurenine formamidase
MTAVSAAEPEKLPDFEDLPVTPDAPPGSSWGVWGGEDQLGTLNLLNGGRTLRALATVRRGDVFNLGLPLEEPRRNVESRRANPRHQILHVGHEHRDFQPGGVDDPSGGSVGRDDYLEMLWLQGSTQWDGLGHFRHAQYGNYNGVRDSDIHGDVGARLGVDNWAPRGIIGRGVLADVAGYLGSIGRPVDPGGNHPITVAELEGTLAWQAVTLEPGDILLVRTGWVGHFMAQSDLERERLITPRYQSNPGLDGSDDMVRYLWDRHVAAVAADNITVEAYPTDSAVGAFYLHANLLPLLGMPMGELWVLDHLAEACAEDQQYAFLLVSVPLNVRGGLGSPAQAVALK